MFEFAYPYLLLLLAAVPFVYIYTAKHKDGGFLLLPNAAKIRRVSRKRHYDPLPLIFALAAILLAAALARPRMGSEIKTQQGQGIDITLALDMSESMEVIDVPADVRNRDDLEKALEDGRAVRRIDSAKNALAGFIAARPHDRIGLVGFGDLAYTLAPPTGDHDFLLRQLRTLQTGQLGQMTGLAAPIAAAVRQLQDDSSGEGGVPARKIIVLFTDGMNTVEDIITPAGAAELAAEKNIILYTVGIGGGQALAEGVFGLSLVNTEFDEEMLEKLAESGGGKYFHAQDSEGLKKVMEEIDQLEKIDFDMPAYTVYREFAPWLTALALLLIFCGIFLKNTLLLRLP